MHACCALGRGHAGMKMLRLIDTLPQGMANTKWPFNLETGLLVHIHKPCALAGNILQVLKHLKLTSAQEWDRNALDT